MQKIQTWWGKTVFAYELSDTQSFRISWETVGSSKSKNFRRAVLSVTPGTYDIRYLWHPLPDFTKNSAGKNLKKIDGIAYHLNAVRTKFHSKLVITVRVSLKKTFFWVTGVTYRFKKFKMWIKLVLLTLGSSNFAGTVLLHHTFYQNITSNFSNWREGKSNATNTAHFRLGFSTRHFCH